MAAKKKKKFTKEGWEKLKAQVTSRTESIFRDHHRVFVPVPLDVHDKNPFDHPNRNSADHDMIYMRGKKNG